MPVKSYTDQNGKRKYYAAFYYTDYNGQRRKKKKEGLTPEFTITLDHLKHVEEFIELMNAITNSYHFSSLPKFMRPARMP